MGALRGWSPPLAFWCFTIFDYPIPLLHVLSGVRVSTESELDELSTEPVQVDPEPDRSEPDRSEPIGPDRAKADPEAPLNLVPLALGAVSATTIAAAGIFTAYGTTGLIVGGVAAGAGLLSVTPARSRRPRSALGRLAAGVSRRSGRSGPGRSGPGRSGPGRSGPGLFGSGRAGSGRSGAGRTGSVGALSRRARSGASAGRGPGRSGPGLFGSGRAGSGRSGAVSGRTGSGRSGSGLFGSTSRSGRTGSAVRAGRSGSGSGFGPSRSGAGRSGSGLFGSTSRSGRTGSGSGLFGRSSTTGRRGSGSALGGLLGAKARRSHGRLSTTGPGGLPARSSAGKRRWSLWPRKKGTLARAHRDKTKKDRRLASAERSVLLPKHRFWTNLYRHVVPHRMRHWLNRKWTVLTHPAGWWERIKDPFWRYQHGHLKPWERSVVALFKGAWDGMAKVFERGDTTTSPYWKDKYGSLPSWEQRLVSWVLGAWLVLSSPFQSEKPAFRIPDVIEEPAVRISDRTSTGEDTMSVYEQALIEAAEAFADAVANYGREVPMLEYGRGISAIAPSLERIGQGFFDMAKRMRDEDPVEEVFIEGVENIGESIHDGAKVAEELPDVFEVAHETKLERLRNPSPGEERWDILAQED